MLSLENAVLILIIILSLWILSIFINYQSERKKETLVGNDLFGDGIYTSGATMRRLGQIFTSTNQGAPVTLYNAENNNEKLQVLLKKIGEN